MIYCSLIEGKLSIHGLELEESNQIIQALFRQAAAASSSGCPLLAEKTTKLVNDLQAAVTNPLPDSLDTDENLE